MTVITTNHALDHVDYEVIEHPRTETATGEARAVGVRPEQVAKTIVLASGQATFVQFSRPRSTSTCTRFGTCSATIEHGF